MERKIGEIFEYNGEWYQCIVGCHCPDCAFCNNNCEERERITLGNKLTKEETTGFCTPEFREDGKSVIFKKLEKVGEPFKRNGKIYQGLISPYGFNNCSMCAFRNISCKDVISCYDDYIFIETKQTKEDMEENHKVEDALLTRLVGRYVNNLIDYETFEKAVKELYSDKKDSKPTLKEFDLEAAKLGKPVCTRDGRKARIICFDRDWDMHIVALVADPLQESVHYYLSNGKVDFDRLLDDDLMMLPEKKEGWVNIDKGGSGKIAISSPYSTKEEAIHNDNECTIDTIKINWSE